MNFDMQEELRKLMLEQSESLQRETFLGVDEVELGIEKLRIRRIRELFAEFLAVMRDTSWSSDLLHEHDYPHDLTANPNSLSWGDMDEKAKVTLPGKVIPPAAPGEVEKAEVTVDGADPLYEEIRIENSLRSTSGEQVRLKRGAQVEVTVEAGGSAVTNNLPANRKTDL